VTGQLLHESSTIDPRYVGIKAAYIHAQKYMFSYKPANLI